MTSIGWRRIEQPAVDRLGADTDMRLDVDVNCRIDRADTAAGWS
jgi:hypothetical protein